jgi:hypothetical protein
MELGTGPDANTTQNRTPLEKAVWKCYATRIMQKLLPRKQPPAQLPGEL